jgi:transposase
VYHEAAAQVFHDAGCEVVIANPRRVRDYAKGRGLLTKTDAVDARVLARYGAQGDDRVAWVPPTPEIRTLRALVARLDAVSQDLQREENRWEKAQATDTPGPVRDSLLRSISALQAERDRLLRALDDHYDPHPPLRQARDQLKTIPGVGDATARRLLCLLKRHRFTSARQAAACVRAAYLDLIGRGKTRMSALGALMRRLIHIAFGILKHQMPFNPALVSKIA